MDIQDQTKLLANKLYGLSHDAQRIADDAEPAHGLEKWRKKYEALSATLLRNDARITDLINERAAAHCEAYDARTDVGRLKATIEKAIDMLKDIVTTIHEPYEDLLRILEKGVVLVRTPDDPDQVSPYYHGHDFAPCAGTHELPVCRHCGCLREKELEVMCLPARCS